MKLEITGAKILRSRVGTDKVYLRTNMPPCIWPHTENPMPSFEVSRGQAESYVRENFGIEPEILVLED